jgi:hypothetical protein
VNRSLALVALMPPAVVTVTSTVPLPDGDVAVICVAPLTVNDVALALPNLTAVAPVRAVPVIVTLVPPVATPLVGEIEVTVGKIALTMKVIVPQFVVLGSPQAPTVSVPENPAAGV